MAHSEADIVPVRLLLTASLELDLERLRQDPTWHTIVADLADPSLEVALEAYLTHYITRERFLRDMPSTCGPGDVQLTKIEDLHVSNTAAGDEPGSGDPDAGIPA